ncbi:uncharacterized protein LOC112571026 isoform X2 [Pomacea canaliculata]|uniref:uncharacterized protein LOC112571026 isoform X2 n=1 Tax=Pomacea canaliculata TaxID=400727 RepID=UPI000D72566D|nr:uncharacterized protein LOC112571026 isoform X2 [Pomacea canaliculata]
MSMLPFTGRHSSRGFTRIVPEQTGLEILLMCLMIPAFVLYTVAIASYEWFAIYPHSYYGVWYVRFCDVLRCQLIPAVFSDEPAWYNILQLLSLFALGGLVLGLYMLLLLWRFKSSQVPSSRQFYTSIVCIATAFVISISLVIFYTKVNSESKSSLQVGWSSVLALISCFCELSAGIIIIQFPNKIRK